MEPRPLTLALHLAVTLSPDGRWTARAELPDGSVKVFTSPFELARFVARVPARQPDPAGRGSLR
ncbi:MAG: hypothetical protein IV097_05650 [Burkholderiaceae bacterium]|nr:hypothetical protein [Burkholderiaceae bacterium]